MHICILGGGTAGWMTAVAISKKLKTVCKSIVLVESEAVGTVGVGEATLPHIKFFNDAMGIQESAFMRATQATFKLGIEFRDWGQKGQSYIHPFGNFGLPVDDLPFYQHWLKLRQQDGMSSLDDYAYGIVSSKKNRFQRPEQGASELLKAYGYAYQFDASLYAKFLRDLAEQQGVQRIEGKVIDTVLDNINGNVTTIALDNGKTVSADLFVDCSGFRGVLIEQALKSGYQDWSQWLPCNKAIAVPCENRGELSPFTRATARTAGWQWRIPLQHRTGNGHVYWDEFISDDEAASQLLNNLDGPALGDPKQLFFKTGRRNHFWKNNVVAIGLSAGFLEPLESTSIHLIQEGITNLIELFPNARISDFDRQEYNSRMSLQYERVRDFLLLHYVANQRDDSEMWRYFNSMTLPDSLQQKIDLWMHRGYVQRYEFGTFLPASWVAVMMGQNLIPRRYDPRVDKRDFSFFQQSAGTMRSEIIKGVEESKSHREFLHTIGAASLTQPLRAHR